MEIIKCKNNFGKIVDLPKEKFQPRPSVYAILRNGNFILTCRNKSNGKLWFPGGGVDEGESNEQALLRECLEETGITNIDILKFLGDFRNYFYYEPEDLAMDAHLYFYECTTTEEKVKANEEVDDDESFDFKWVPIDQIAQDDLADLNENIYNILKSLVKNS